MMMSNHGDFVGRIQDSWHQRAAERTTFRGELRLIPRWLIRVLVTLYAVAVVGVVCFSLTWPNELPDPLPTMPVVVRLLAMVGIVTGAAAAVIALVLFYGYIAADAKRRGMNPVLWLLVALLVPYLIGAILYFIVREPLPLDCPQCGRKVNPHFNFCPHCQFNLRPNCPQCRRGTRLGDRFCPHCGFTLQPDAGAQVAAPTP
jgi:hypothetical protein